ncbi:general substrate transporter [Kockovaella imperatae]|uniref:General substrate transporter n=1 Tax=Kockovaella imperatae TaxID=4999 RepID=A0A1Y1UJE7_9TREE|nr:general substrate transporter [Kockovaella imperatae]ORX38190.1 general substrate transporter [Kockovaella imperatae]
MSAEDRATALKLANEADPGPPISSWAHIQFLLTCFIVIVNSCDTGFDTTIMSSVNSMKQFQNFFGLTSGSPSTGIVFGIYTVGGVTAFFPNIILPDLIGRRYSMLWGNTLLIIGACISANSRSMSMLLGGRWLTGFGCSTAALSAKTYMSEITSPRSRGRYMGVLNSFYYVGQIIATGVAIPLGRVASEYSWRTCLYLQCGPAIINALFVLFIAESPRWLYARGRKEEAVAILAKYHSRDNDPTSPLIRLQVQEIEENISVNGADRRFWDFRMLFNSRSNRYRFGLCVIISCWGQLAGNGMITYFLPVLLELAGIVDRDRQRQLNLVNSCTSMIGALSGSAIVDHVGRRKLLLFGISAAACGMLIVGCLLSPAGEQSQTRANAGISFIFLFMVVFSFGMTPLQGLYPAEVLTFENRAKGLSLQGWVTNAVSTINTFGLPPALGKVGYIMYLIFFAWDIVGVITVWLFAVETKQLTLEEMEDIFTAPYPKKRSFEVAKAARERVKRDKERRSGVVA